MVQERQAAREGCGLFRQDGRASLQQQQQTDKWDRNRVESNRNNSERDNAVVFVRVVAVQLVVCLEELRFIVKLVAEEGLERK